MNETMKNRPRSGQIYTLAEILQLYLRDSPFLMFLHNHHDVVIQNYGAEERLCVENPRIADSKWEYRYETDEWIPIFRYKDDRPITDIVTVEPTKWVDSDTGLPEANKFYARFIGDYEPELTAFEEEMNRERAEMAKARIGA